ncbi:glucosaminidase domain-containing protein [Spirosoma oryzae]|uniref:glucosaminidase domain-containing protein n=1 Tax=Spirosoma oryzae TaxID=1469603 RepID=UPI000D05519A
MFLLCCTLLLQLVSPFDSAVRLVQSHPAIRYKALTVAQMIHESANGRSRLFRRHLNPYGFIHGAYSDYRAGKWAGYRSVESSVSHFARWQQTVIRKHRLTSYSRYSHWIYQTYARDPRYRQKLARLLKQPANQKNTAPTNRPVPTNGPRLTVRFPKNPKRNTPDTNLARKPTSVPSGRNFWTSPGPGLTQLPLNPPKPSGSPSSSPGLVTLCPLRLTASSVGLPVSRLPLRKI